MSIHIPQCAQNGKKGNRTTVVESFISSQLKVLTGRMVKTWGWRWQFPQGVFFWFLPVVSRGTASDIVLGYPSREVLHADRCSGLRIRWVGRRRLLCGPRP